MDVQCERCKTEYEFDDALVSGRGTTVKCTNCGLQFKVRPAANAADAERWIVHTALGKELTFTSLRDLQRAITTHEVGRGDTLRRGNSPPRTLGTIAELEPFFLARPPRNSERPGAYHPGHDDGRSRVPTLRPPPAMAVPPSGPVPRLARVPTGDGGVDRTAPAYSEAGTMMAPALQSSAAPSVVSRQPSSPPLGEEISARPHPSRPPPPAARAKSMGPPALPVRRLAASADLDDTSEPIDSMDDADSRYAPSPPRRRMGGWIVAAVLLACVGVIGYKVGEPYLTTAAHAPARKPLNPKVEQYLTEGEAAFREGNLELAKEKFDRASGALDETAPEPRVLLDVARLAAARADVPWLLTRILPESSVDELRAAKEQLTSLGAVAKRSAEAASTAAPDDAAATRARVDALRIVGERDAARASVNKLTVNASQPETAYVLAALDLSEMEPLWATVVDRLRVAAAGEGNAGRARAALVYALARSGDAVGARAELDRLRALPTPYPIFAPLAAFVARAPVGAAPKGSASAVAASPAAAPPAVDVDSLPRRPVNGGGGGGAGGGAADESAGGGGGGDARDLMRQAASAENKGQFAKARKLYEDATHVDPANSEALAGLGSVALKMGDNPSARSYFGRALSLNPNFVPALVGQADAMWAEGDHAGATGRYKEIVDRFPESSGYPSYVKTRAEGSASGTTAPPAATPATPATPPTPPTTPPATPPPPADPSPAPKPAAPSGGTMTLPANVPSDLPGTPP